MCLFADGWLPGDSDWDGDSGSDSGLHLPWSGPQRNQQRFPGQVRLGHCYSTTGPIQVWHLHYTWSWMLDFFTLHMNRMTFVFLRTGSALSLLYGTSATLEHHHFNHAVMILQSEVNLQAPWNPKFSIFVECSSVYYKWLSGHIHTYLIIWTKLSHIQHIFSHSRSRFSQYTQQLRRIDGLHFGFKQLTMNYLNYSTKLQILENLSRN